MTELIIFTGVSGGGKTLAMQHFEESGFFVTDNIPVVVIKDFFDEQDGNGMKYAYIYPGFNKVLQAAGRVIRTHEDVGIVALLDYRFKNSSYRELYPKEWSNLKVVNRDNIEGVLSEFWSE